MDKSSLGHIPKSDKWVFDESVTDCFLDMLKKSIPQYDEMRSLVNKLTKEFYLENSFIMDLGSSRGDSVSDLVSNSDMNFILTEISDPMLDFLNKRFENKKNVFIEKFDLRELNHKNLCELHPFVSINSVVLSILTLQFTPIEYRQEIIQKIYDNLSLGGAFIFVEKILGSNSHLNNILVKEYLDFKKSNGYTDIEIERKKLSLEGVLVPVTSKWNEELLLQAGFKKIDCFWRYLNFSGWIAIK